MQENYHECLHCPTIHPELVADPGLRVAAAARALDHGVFPAKDSWVHGFDQRYLRHTEG